MLLSKNAMIAAGMAAGTFFIGYCVYFDKKRRSDPNYKKMLKEKRKQKKSKTGSATVIPNLNNYEEVQKFFLEEVRLGEELLANGDLEDGVVHLSNAVAVCGQPQQLLAVLQQSLPAPVFHLLLQRLPLAGQRLLASSSGIQEEELE
uniref:Translocase of outer mitochondrial membrane 20-like protein n=1 Tax=Artemia franciscana TaxID=6661 RepID=B7TA03_ARTSF|nr:translocase of outer mitochondrial membrane 20-like protein [Artemia franciscana]